MATLVERGLGCGPQVTFDAVLFILRRAQEQAGDGGSAGAVAR
jgi:hypothetical protein